jgi:hypothetical protein
VGRVSARRALLLYGESGELKSFGPLSEQQQQAMERLRERFFPKRTRAELVPDVEPLPG